MPLNCWSGKPIWNRVVVDALVGFLVVGSSGVTVSLRRDVE